MALAYGTCPGTATMMNGKVHGPLALYLGALRLRTRAARQREAVAVPDFPLPHCIEDAIDEIREAHRRAASQRVEIACGVGIGIGIGSHDFPSAGPYRSFRTAQAVAPVPITTATV